MNGTSDSRYACPAIVRERTGTVDDGPPIDSIVAVSSATALASADSRVVVPRALNDDSVWFDPQWSGDEVIYATQ